MSKKSRRVAVQRRAGSPSTDGAAGARSTYWPALTGVRGLAALLVFLLHAYVLGGQPASLPAPLAWVFTNGWSGVDIFFTLSAFLLTLPFLAALEGKVAPNLRTYGRHRLLRILPAYYAQLFALGLVAMVSAGLIAGKSVGWSGIAASFTFLYGLLPGVQPAVPPWWTLPVELGFYLVLPFFARLLTPGRWLWLLLWIALSLGYRFWLMHAGLDRSQEVAWVEHLPGRLHQFLVGMLAAYAYVRLQERPRPWSPAQADWIAAISMLAFLLLPMAGLLVSDRVFQGAPVREPLLLCWHLFASIVVGLMLIALCNGARYVSQVFAAVPLRVLGIVSYSLYLWHYPVLLWVRDGLGGIEGVRTNFWAFLFCGLLFSLLVAAASWWLVERPAQQWGRQAKLVP